MDIQNFRDYLRFHNPPSKIGEPKKAKTFSLSGIESKLNLPSKLLDNFVSDRTFRGKEFTLGDYEGIVLAFFEGLGYNDNVNYNQFL